MQIVEVRGRDSADFLQRVSAGGVKGVEIGAGRAGLLLNGQSRMIAQFDLLRMEKELYWLAAPEACVAALAAELERLHFSEDLAVTVTERRAGAKGKEGVARRENGSFVFHWEGSEVAWPSPVPGFLFSTAVRGFPEGWDFARIGELVPWPPADWNATTPALEAGVLPWIDRDKGCYPGQEVVERSLNVGHPARVLVAWEGVRDLHAGENVTLADPATFGTVTSAAEQNGKVRALVRVPWGQREFLPPGWVRVRSHW
jgi:folate-binding protein YgfZ